jgi:hypothetical protein
LVVLSGFQSRIEEYISLSLSLRVVREDLGANVSPSNTRKTTNSKSSTKAAPSLCTLKRIGSNAASAEGLDANGWALRLEGNGTIHRKASCEDENKASSTQATRNFSSSFNITEWSELDEWADQEETVGQADFYSSKEGRDTGAVCWQVGEVASDKSTASDWSLQHTNEWVAIQWLDNLCKGQAKK